MKRIWVIGTLACIASAQPVVPTVIVADADHAWGYRGGIKQHLGSYMLGRSVHNISKRTDGIQGEPDCLMLVDERAGTAAVLDIGHFTGAVENPGGMATFPDGPPGDFVPPSGSLPRPSPLSRVWFVMGGRAHVLPFDLVRSQIDSPEWNVLLDDFESSTGSTTVMFRAVGEVGLMVYRKGTSASVWTTIRFQRYDLTEGEPAVDLEKDLLRGELDALLGPIGLEQGIIRWDPRMRALAVSWQWWNVDERQFGSCQFLYTDDLGLTWRTADGEPVSDLPVDWSERDATLVPRDHVGMGQDTGWNPGDIGWSPGGTPWLLIPDASEQPELWRWTGSGWSGQKLAGPLLPGAKPFALVATRGYLVFAYAAGSALFARVSADDGETWSDPTPVDSVEPPYQFGWVSAIQPADRYIDDAARFMVGDYDTTGGLAAQNYRNAIRLVKLQVGKRSDSNADGSVDLADCAAFVSAWSERRWEADFDDDGDTDLEDCISYLRAYRERW